MVLAYLRGLLHPGYPQGVRSKIREELVLRAISRQVDSKAAEARAVINSNVMGSLTPSYRQQAFKESMQFLGDSISLAKLLDFETIEKKRPKLENERDVQNLMQAFTILRETDFFYKLDAALKATT